MSYNGKISTDKWYPITCYNTTMSGVTGITYSRVTVRYGFENSVLTTYNASGNWNDRGSGQYELQIGASEWTSSGIYRVHVIDNSGIFVDHVFTVETKSLYDYELSEKIASIYNAEANLSGQINTAYENLRTLINDVDAEVISGMFNEVLAGTKDFRTAVIEMWAYAANKVDISSTSSGILHSYYDPTDSGLYSLEATVSGRIRTDL
jgi:hypothetical protein